MILRRRTRGPFFFVHLQKTAGTSLTSQLRDRFGTAAVYPDTSDLVPEEPVEVLSVTSVEHLQERWRERRREIQVVTGHFPLCTTELLDDEFRTFTLLREPVSRTLSYLRHHRKMVAGDRHLSLTEIYEDPFRFHGLVHNHMVKMFSLTAQEMTAGALTPVEFTEERLDAAKKGLETVDVIGVQEDYPGFCTQLRRSFGWRLGKERHLNRSQSDAPEAELAERIRTDNAHDIELYRFALELITRRTSPS